jgi:diguanylate cyclase (GGDEF)-like protein
MERFVIQVESIRESCRQLAAIVNVDLKQVIKQAFYSTVVVLIIGMVCLFWGSYIFARLFKSSIKDIQNGIDEVNSGHYRKIKLSYESVEFSSFVDKFNEMTEQLNKTTVSRDKCKKMVEDRTFELRKLSSTDQLTCIANRRALFDRGAMEFFREERHGGSLSLILLDCDHFKKINDTYGHLVGDKVLQHICRVVEKQIREVDLLARYGGEEFVIILPHCNLKGAEENAKRIMLALAANPVVIDGLSIKVTVSIGVATVLVTHSSFEQLLSDADKAMFNAKSKGRNRIELFEPSHQAI